MAFLLRSRNKRGIGAPASFGGLALADFLNGDYQVSGAPVTAAAVVSDTGRISGSGLSITASDVELLGGIRDALLTASWTVVVEMELGAPAGVGHFVTPFYLVAPLNYTIQCFVVTSNGGTAWQPRFYEDSGVGGYNERSMDDESAEVSGIVKVAWTRINASAAMSINGSAIVTTGDAVTAAPHDEVFAASHDETGTIGHIRRIEVYSPADNAELPGLSTVS